jgi:hypothetical protein
MSSGFSKPKPQSFNISDLMLELSIGRRKIIRKYNATQIEEAIEKEKNNNNDTLLVRYLEIMKEFSIIWEKQQTELI